MRTPDEIQDEIDRAYASSEKHGSQWPGMSYEDGVRDALLWATEESDEAPMADSDVGR